MFRVIILALAALLLAACNQSADAPNPTLAAAAPPAVNATTTATPSAEPLTATPTTTPQPSATPTPSPTPLPSAELLTISGEPRADLLTDPEPSGRYPCGAVDLFDFPISPPDALDIPRSGGDFGVFRDRYGKYHAGEDWSGTTREGSLGTPVYSIGHGLVTYAEPLGWGRDQGVVIVQHTFTDGSTLLSFYGHLDPDTVTLSPGLCVARGEEVGHIGQPRTSPHLHFEVRTHEPYVPLTGYWPDDPTAIGWLSPSQVIWDVRTAAQPNVSWTRPSGDADTQLIADLDDQLLLVENRELLLVDSAEGDSQPVPLALADEEDSVATAAISAEGDVAFVGLRSGAVQAYQLPEWTLLWETDPPDMGLPQLLALPDGGVVLADRSQLLALSSAGETLWAQEVAARPSDWLLTDDALWLTWGGDLAETLQIAAGEPPTDSAEVGGLLAAGDDAVWLYGEDGVYHWQNGEWSRPLGLPPAQMSLRDIVGLPDGGAVVAFGGPDERRLMQLDAAGELVWQGGLPSEASGFGELAVVDGQLYWGSVRAAGAQAVVFDVYRVDSASQSLHHLFQSGTRVPDATANWLAATRTGLLVNVGGGPLARVDTAVVR